MAIRSHFRSLGRAMILGPTYWLLINFMGFGISLMEESGIEGFFSLGSLIVLGTLFFSGTSFFSWKAFFASRSSKNLSQGAVFSSLAIPFGAGAVFIDSASFPLGIVIALVGTALCGWYVFRQVFRTFLPVIQTSSGKPVSQEAETRKRVARPIVAPGLVTVGVVRFRFAE